MRLSGLLVAVWLGALSLPAAYAAGAADAIFTQANAALASGQYPEARALATSGLAEPALDALLRSRLLVVRGLAHQAQGGANEALLDFTTALQGNALDGEERARALFARGLTLDGQGRLDIAVGDYTAALVFAPRAPYALNNRANVYRRQNRMTEAKRDYTAALEANTPNPQYPWYGLGQVAEAEGDPQVARNFYSRALIADPGFALARERLEAMGAPVEGPAGLPADTGIIVLKPPGPRLAEAPLVLKPPQAAGAVPAVPVVRPKPAPVIRVAEPARPAQSPPGRGAPLRPAIVEGAPQRSSGAPQAQLGAWRSEVEARQGWEVAQASADGLLDGLAPAIVAAQIPGRGNYYRLRVPARGGVSQFCGTLATKGLACIPARD